MRTLTTKEIETALTNDAWDLGNQVLYDLCSKYPLHKSHQEIIAKVWLIGRSYSAALERRKNKSADSLGDLFYEDIAAPEIQKSEIDRWIEPLNGNSNSEEIIETHFKLTDLFRMITELEKRSLASKYLHFHRPDIFFIYDSRAVNAIRQITPQETGQLPSLSPRGQVDDEYFKFYRRCLWLRDDLENKIARRLSPREIDKIFLFVTDRMK